MKKVLILAAAFALLSAPAAFAGNASGCGLGQQLFKGQSGLVPNILAATTNGISGNQTFGITSGTLGCDADATVYNEQMQEAFVAVNFDNLSEDMAQGDGQYVRSLSTLMGCPADLQGDFAQLGQDKYESLFSSPEVEAKTFLDGLKSEIRQDGTLANACTNVG